mmetsp:Transcript_21908/g.36677  ORF Transcript_21908/g.36677 Transcript_21908/m.36677 type:complete len:187 (-) Transcript_21908:973-1533(-)|eukprot:CAMPEP_0174981340 /NCGR_PEP_ID=MMETSP0004_2-20121128/15834_1 /TAXON_ID=420556 /ORGANISM="Ochromonas sp., Strain CCMP1393" /LENGTH=186 /DNA_ID=CAMNT_0016233071 /DNA_START=85 /DNA_END=645 /DNA_ORIENTATION=+
MGFFKMISNAVGWSKKGRVLVIGLDNSGKTTLIHHMKPKKATTTEITPTVGFQVEEFSKNNINFTVYDMSGQGRYRSLWEHYYSEVEAIIFVLDSTDRLRMCVAKEELEQLLSHPEIGSSRAPIVFFANKRDVAGSMGPEECTEELGLDRIRDRGWSIWPSNALSGEGINDGIEWLCNNIGSGRRK